MRTRVDRLAVHQETFVEGELASPCMTWRNLAGALQFANRGGRLPRALAFPRCPNGGLPQGLRRRR